MKTQLSNDGINHYFNVSVVNNYQLDDYVYNMLSQRPPMALPCKFYDEDMYTFTYKINGLQSLSELIKGGIRFEVLMDVLKQMVDAQLALAEYLIDSQQIIFSNDAIFVDVVTYDVYFVILPLQDYNGNLSFQDWLTMVLNSQSIIEINRFLYNKLLSYVHADDFCLSGLNHILSQNNINAVYQSQDYLLPKTNEMDELFAFTKDELKPIDSTVLNDKAKELTKNDAKRNKLKKIKINNKFRKMTFLLCQILLVYILRVAWMNASIFMNNITKCRIIICLIFISVDILIAYKLFKFNDNQINDCTEVKQVKSREKAKHSTRGKKDVLKMAVKQKLSKNSPTKPTELLTSSTHSAPFLLNKKTGSMVTIDQEKYIIGREAGESDILVDCMTVGRKHCEITRHSLSCEILDLTSKNGTFINGQKISDSVPRPLNHGDLVTIADIEFQYFAF